MTRQIATQGKYDPELIARLETAAEIAREVNDIDSELVDPETRRIDPVALDLYRVSDLRGILGKLDGIVRGNWEAELLESNFPHDRLLVESVCRARALSGAIREAVAGL